MRRVSFILCFSIVLSLFCTEDYNPFSVADNANIYFSDATTLENEDTVSIFSSETLQILVTNREMVDSFSIKACHNRFWSDTTIHSFVKPHKYTFVVSFTQTGNQQIKLTTFRSNGDVVPKTLTIHTFSPLNQQTIENMISGEEIELCTDSVKDRDILYTWKLGDMEILSPKADTTITFFPNNLTDQTGQLWIYDHIRNVKSPIHEFSFSYIDTINPVISIAMEEFEGMDTIRVSEDVFAITFHISDSRQVPVWKALINNDPFDRKDLQNRTYTKIIRNIRKKRIIDLEILAIDNRISSNSEVKKVTIVYDSEADPFTFTHIRYGLDTTGRQTFIQQNRNIFGHIEDLFRHAVDIRVSIGDETYTQRVQIDHTTGEGQWHFEDVPLSDDNPDTLQIVAFDTLGNQLARKEYYLIYDPDSHDNTPPVLYKIEANGNLVTHDPTYIREDSLQIRITAFDNGSGIDSFYVNSSPVSPSSSNMYIREVTLDSIDHDSIVTITLYAVDKQGNTVTDTMSFIYNDPPRLQRKLRIPHIVLPDTVYRDTIQCISDDKDSIWLNVQQKPLTMEITRINGKQWALQWEPTYQDTGKQQTIAFILDDKKETSEMYTKVFNIIDSSKIGWRIQMSLIDSLPLYIEAVRDTLLLPLDIQEGFRPFQISLLAVRDSTVLFDSLYLTDTIKWTPDPLDTGRIHLTINIEDRVGQTDTILQDLTVVSYNQPCSVYIDNNSENGINMIGKNDLDTVNIHVSDPDSNYLGFAESIDLTIIHRGDKITVPLNHQLSTQYILSPSEEKNYVDTLTMIAIDRRSHSDTLHIPVHYGIARPKPQGVSPQDSATIIDTALTFSWSCKNSEHYSYDFFLLAEDTIHTMADDIADMSITVGDLNKSGEYSWYISVNDTDNTEWYSDTSIVFLRNPGHVKFTTTEMDFPPRLVADKDTLSVLLEISENSTHPPFEFSAAFKENNESIIDTSNNRLIWFVPHNSDTGYLHGEIKVTDANNNSDVLFPIIEIVPLETNTFTVSATLDDMPIENDTLDMTFLQNISIDYVILDHTDGTLVPYTITIEQNGLHTEENLYISGRKVSTLTVQTDSDKSGYETIRTIVCRNTTACDTTSIHLFYGDDEEEDNDDL